MTPNPEPDVLEEIEAILLNNFPGDGTELHRLRISNASLAISQSYIAKERVREAIGEDDDPEIVVQTNSMGVEYEEDLNKPFNELRAEIRGKLGL